MDLLSSVHVATLLILVAIVFGPILLLLRSRAQHWTRCPLCLNAIRTGATRCPQCHGEISR